MKNQLMVGCVLFLSMPAVAEAAWSQVTSTNGQCLPQSSAPQQHIAAGGSGFATMSPTDALWVVGCEQQIYYYNSGSPFLGGWQASGGYAPAIATNTFTSVWAIPSDGSIWQWLTNSSSWSERALPGAARSGGYATLGVSGTASRPVIWTTVDSNAACGGSACVGRFDVVQGTWSLNSKAASYVTVDPVTGAPWIIDTAAPQHQIWKGDPWGISWTAADMSYLPQTVTAIAVWGDAVTVIASTAFQGCGTGVCGKVYTGGLGGGWTLLDGGAKLVDSIAIDASTNRTYVQDHSDQNLYYWR